MADFVVNLLVICVSVPVAECSCLFVLLFSSRDTEDFY